MNTERDIQMIEAKIRHEEKRIREYELIGGKEQEIGKCKENIKKHKKLLDK